MRIYKNKAFSKWAAKESLSDKALLAAVAEIGDGLVDADLGGYVYKKPVALGGRGNSGGLRSILAYKAKDKAFFVYGFAKNVRTNISAKELKALKQYAALLLSYSEKELRIAVTKGVLIEVDNDG